MLLRERTYWVKGEDSPFERLLNALYYSSIIYVVLGLAWVLDGRGRHDISRLYAGDYAVQVYLSLAFVGLFALPFVISELGRRWQKSKKLRPWFLKRARIDPGHGVPAGWEQLGNDGLIWPHRDAFNWPHSVRALPDLRRFPQAAKEGGRRSAIKSGVPAITQTSPDPITGIPQV